MTPVKNGYTIAIKQTTKDGKDKWRLTKIISEGPLMYSRKLRFIDAVMTSMSEALMRRVLNTDSYHDLLEKTKILHIEPRLDKDGQFTVATINYNLLTFFKKNEKFIKARYSSEKLFQFLDSELQKKK